MDKFTRREFCKAVGAGTLACGISSASLAGQLTVRRTKVFGIGGAGCDVVRLLRERLPADTSVTTRTVRWSLNPPRVVDLDFAPGFSREMPSPEQLVTIAEEVSDSDLVVLVTGFASRRAANLTYEFAHAAKESGAKVVSALVLAYPLMWSDFHLPRALKAASRVVEISDRAECIDAKSLGVPFQAEGYGHSVHDCMRTAIADLVMAEISVG